MDLGSGTPSLTFDKILPRYSLKPRRQLCPNAEGLRMPLELMGYVFVHCIFFSCTRFRTRRTNRVVKIVAYVHTVNILSFRFTNSLTGNFLSVSTIMQSWTYVSYGRVNRKPRLFGNTPNILSLMVQIFGHRVQCERKRASLGLDHKFTSTSSRTVSSRFCPVTLYRVDCAATFIGTPV